MLSIRRFTCENLERNCVTDEKNPRFSFVPESDRPGAKLVKAKLTVGDWSTETTEQIAIPYGGVDLKPFTRYEATVEITDDAGETAKASLTFETLPGRACGSATLIITLPRRRLPRFP